MNVVRIGALTAVLVAVVSLRASAAVTVTVDQATRHQVVEGFGGFGGMNPWWSGGPFYDQNWLNLLVDELGLTVFRTEFYPDGPNGGDWSKQVLYYRALKAKCEQSGVPFKMMVSVWTPPANMKTSGNTVGGTLVMGQVGAYGDYLASFLQKFKTDIGTDVNVISPQNEPNNCTFFNCCTYSVPDLVTMLRGVAPKIRAVSPSIRMTYTDDISGAASYFTQVHNEIIKDATASSIGSVVSAHYDCVVGTIGNAAKTSGKQAWNTEFGNGSDDWNGQAWVNARFTYSMLANSFSAVIYWLLGPHTTAAQAEESVMYNRTVGPKARVLQIFARTIRPGSVRVQATSSSANTVGALAFVNDQTGRAVVVLLNNSSSAQTVTVNWSGLAPGTSFAGTLTSPSDNFASKGSTAVGGSVTVPVKGIYALVSSAGAVSVSPKVATVVPASRPRTANAVTFGLDGRRVNVAQRGATTGVYCSSTNGVSASHALRAR